jgi:hypothetical protein
VRGLDLLLLGESSSSSSFGAVFSVALQCEDEPFTVDRSLWRESDFRFHGAVVSHCAILHPDDESTTSFCRKATSIPLHRLRHVEANRFFQRSVCTAHINPNPKRTYIKRNADDVTATHSKVMIRGHVKWTLACVTE